ncbi:MAG: hypothetical protein V4597_11685 [Pseudomonadota bacterium]
MLFAENPFGLSDTVLLAIVGIVAMVVKELLDQWKARVVAAKVAVVAEKAEVVAAKAEIVAAKVAEVANHAASSTAKVVENTKAVLALKADVEEIHAATNSMKDALVKATGDAAFAAGKESGAAEQKAKQDTGPENLGT